MRSISRPSVIILTTLFAGALSLVSAATPASASNYTFHLQLSAASGTPCLGSNSQGQSDIGACDTSSATQTWHYASEQDNYSSYQLVNGDGRCLGISGGTGPQLTIGQCTGTIKTDPSQWWELTENFTLENQKLFSGDSECAGTKGSKTGGGTLVILGTACGYPTVTMEWWEVDTAGSL